MNRWRKIFKWLAKGHAINAYTDLFEHGIITAEEYLQLIKEIENNE